MTVEIVNAHDVMERLSFEWRSFAAAPTHLVPAQVVMAGGQPVAIGTLQRNVLHPNPAHFEYRLADDVPVAYLMTLFDELVAASDLLPDALIHVTVDKGNQAMMTWAVQAGFVQRMVTRQCRLAPLAHGEVSITDRLLRLVDHDTPGLRHQLAMLHARIYRSAHSWNPPCELIDTCADDLFMGEDLLPEHLWYVVGDDAPVGVASLRRSDVTGCLELGWIGTLPGVEPGLKRQLIDAALRSANGQTILIEVDDNEAELLAQLRQLPTKWESAAIRFERTV